MRPYIDAALDEAANALTKLRNNAAAHDAIEQAAQVFISAFENGHRLFSCGNGGSMCDAMHFAEELSGRWRLNRRALGATAISDVGHLTCVANDFGYENVFSRYLEGVARTGDVLVGISTSGTSKNILKACETARQKGMKVVTLTGKADSPIGKLADVDICTPGGQYADRVQELHIKVIHILIELVERKLCPENYA